MASNEEIRRKCNAKWKRTCLQDVAWLAKDLCMTSVSASVSLYNLL